MDYMVAFWNLENLFAPEGFADREAWMAEALQRDLAGWTQTLFERKVGQLASVIAQMQGATGPDLLGVCEVENGFALQALADHLNVLCPQRRYRTLHVDAKRDQRGVDTAFIFDAQVLEAVPGELFSHWVMRRTGTRDITQATFATRGGHELIALANHWPSRSAPVGLGPQYSSGFRATAGETLAYWHERIREIKGPDAAIVAMGDFNDDPFDASLIIHAQGLRDRGDVERARSAKFYNLSWRYLVQEAADRQGNRRQLRGTLYHDGDACVFDQILVSRGLLTGPGKLQVDECSARIEAFAQMVDHRVSHGPIRFGLSKGNAAENVNTSGCSDHFPVSVMIRET